MNENEKKTFISYSWDDESHTDWVNRFAAILRNNGIHSLLDQFHVFPGSNLEKFMETGINESRWILCVISDGYIRKINIPESGVCKEFSLLKERAESDYVIPILKNNTASALPQYFYGKFWVDFDHELENDGFKKLISRIHGFDVALVPEVKSMPYSKMESHQRLIEAEIEKTTFISVKLHGTVTFDYSKNDGSFVLGSGEYEFQTLWSKASDRNIHALNDNLNGGKLARFKNLQDVTLIESTRDLSFTSRHQTPCIGDGIVWINRKGNMAITKILGIKDDTRGAQSDELVFEYWILEKSI